jgi:ferredoxin
MKISVETDKCVGAGQCAMVAPAVFDQNDDDGVVIVLEESPGPEHEADVEEAAMLCPAQVILLHQ